MSAVAEAERRWSHADLAGRISTLLDSPAKTGLIANLVAGSIPPDELEKQVRAAEREQWLTVQSNLGATQTALAKLWWSLPKSSEAAEVRALFESMSASGYKIGDAVTKLILGLREKSPLEKLADKVIAESQP